MGKEYKIFKQLRTLYAMGVVRGELPSQELFLRNAFDLMTRKIPENQDRYIWYSLFAPSEIVHAMGTVAIEGDFMSAYMGTFGYTKKLLAHVEQEHGLKDVCSYHKMLIGALALEILPVPRALVVCGNCCDSVRKLGTYVSEMFGSQVFIIDAPRKRSEPARRYIEGQLVELTRFIGEVTGVPFSMDRLREAVRRSNEAASYWKRALDVRKGRPLLKGLRAMRQFLNIQSTFGTPQAVELTKAFYEDMLRLRENQAATPEGDLCRLMWFHNVPVYKSILDRLEEEFGATVVVELMAYPHQERVDEEDIFGSIADRLLTHPIVTIDEQKRRYCSQLAKEFQVDGAIQQMHLNCRGNYGVSRCLQDSLREVEIPLLFLEMDGVDDRSYSEEQARTRVQAFVESIRARREHLSA